MTLHWNREGGISLIGRKQNEYLGKAIWAGKLGYFWHHCIAPQYKLMQLTGVIVLTVAYSCLLYSAQWPT